MTRWCWLHALRELAMNRYESRLSRQYATMLQSYLTRKQERALQQAYELGREAISLGLGVFHIARIHQHALAVCLATPLSPDDTTRLLNAAETVFLEVLSPFEATHRGFREANTALQRRNGELAELNRHLRALSTQVLHVQEEERKRISRELHDEVGQALTAISMNLSALERDCGVNAVRFKKTIGETGGLLQATMETVHSFARELRPAMLDEIGLLPTLRSYLRGFAKRSGIDVKLQASSKAEQLSSEAKTVMFRIAQESLTNVAKHAHATRVSVTLRKITRGIKMEIEDDGRSFRAGVDGKERLGLLGMQERARLVDGCFAVEPTPGKGTTVRVEIPFPVQAPGNV
jgi:signal transduction histidine kinase